MVKPIPPQNVTDTWPAQNIIDPETRSPEVLLGTTLTLTILTLAIVAARTYVRFFSLRAPGWDDYFIFVATVRALAPPLG